MLPCKICRLQLWRRVRPTPLPTFPMSVLIGTNLCLKAPFSLGNLGYGSTPSLQLLSGPLCPGMIVHDRVPSMDQIKLFDHLVVIYKAFGLGVVQGRTNGAPNETGTHKWMFAILACSPFHHPPCLTIKLCANKSLMLNWIVLNRIISGSTW